MRIPHKIKRIAEPEAQTPAVFGHKSESNGEHLPEEHHLLMHEEAQKPNG